MASSIRLATGAFILTAAVLKAAPVIAEPSQQANVSFVKTTDLDLSTAAGRLALDRRLVVAAGEVCGLASAADLAGRNQVRQCRAEKLANARSRGDAIASRNARPDILVASQR